MTALCPRCDLPRVDLGAWRAHCDRLEPHVGLGAAFDMFDKDHPNECIATGDGSTCGRPPVNWRQRALQAESYSEAQRRLVVEVRDEVRWFVVEMERQLRNNDHKGGWHADDLHALIKRLREETKELAEAVDAAEPTISDVVKEAADVANFAMMIADNARNVLGFPARRRR